MASDERSEAGATVREGECTPRLNGETAKPTLESASRLGLKDLTNFSGGSGRVRKRSTGMSLGQRAKPSQLKSNLRDFFYESRVCTPEGGKRGEDGTIELIEAAQEEGIDDWAGSDGPSGSTEKKGEEQYTRLFIAQNEHHSSRTFRRTQSQYEDFSSRKRASLDGDDSLRDEATERKRSSAIVLTDDSTVLVEPEDDEVFEKGESSSALILSSSTSMLDKEGSPMSEYGIGCAVMHHRANFERTLSASVLERGEFAPPLRDHPHLPALPNIVYELPLVPTKDCQVHSVAFGCISAHTLAAEMQNLGLDEFHHKYVLVDCRYPYEYNGGHIKNAINLHDNFELPPLFFPPESILEHVDRTCSKKEEGEGEGADSSSSKKPTPPHRRIPIFYCEYSQKRGPTMAHDLRSIDRRRNIDRYPAINYDVMYLLECGYRNFYNTFGTSNAELFSSQCGYVEMKHEMKQLGKFKAHRKRTRARQVQHSEAVSTMSPTTPAPRKAEGRQASMVAREKIRETLSKRLGSAKARLQFDSEEEKSPMKKKEGLKETDL
ncbi:hypothetical protein PMAYCL1PPCAC_28498 [Pristionchus mayeri]|uniref:Rhodanese domain-containing protein n=1 Tax=Pristionchus mayeri TaxID=1317129 RepID=A0AAN5IA24_9BILA|nr:hypothetical protein PMAYCL1PPCAC_28498 [Pristionchus mayeri]